MTCAAPFQLLVQFHGCRYTVEPQLVDIGPMLFDRASEKDITIHNKGKVKFEYDVDTSALSRPGICEVSTKSGSVLPGQHAVLKLKVDFLSLYMCLCGCCPQQCCTDCTAAVTHRTWLCCQSNSFQSSCISPCTAMSHCIRYCWLIADPDVGMQVTPGMPDRIKETLSIRVAHFQPQVVTLLGEGVYPSLSLTLPRVRSPEYQQALAEAQESLQQAAAAKAEVVPR